MSITKTILAGLLAVSSVFALPTLQLDLSGGVYDISTQTVVNTSNEFNLTALLSASDYSGTYYISMAVTPKALMAEDIGSFIFGNSAIDISMMQYGTPPVDDYVAKHEAGIAPHGVFPTFFYEYAFSFSGSRALEYNVQDNPGSLIDDPNGQLFYQSFTVDMSGLNPNYGIHFDLYNKVPSKTAPADLDVGEFAPFSHDAEAKNVPEPATLSLFGVGLLALSGMGLIRRRI